MSAKKELPVSSAADSIKLAGSVVLFLMGMIAYYQTEHAGYPVVVAILLLFAFVIASIFLFSRSAKGSVLLQFFSASRQELRRVVWPTRQETFQLTLVVVFVVMLFGLFLWIVDKMLAFLRFNLIGG